MLLETRNWTLWLTPSPLVQNIRAQIKEIKDRGNSFDREKASLSILEALAQSNLPDCEKTVRRLSAEGQVLVIAGAETTAWTLSVITFYLLSNPPMLRRLREELDQAAAESSEPATCTRLEKLPYLVRIRCTQRLTGRTSLTLK